MSVSDWISLLVGLGAVLSPIMTAVIVVRITRKTELVAGRLALLDSVYASLANIVILSGRCDFIHTELLANRVVYKENSLPEVLQCLNEINRSGATLLRAKALISALPLSREESSLADRIQGVLEALALHQDMKEKMSSITLASKAAMRQTLLSMDAMTSVRHPGYWSRLARLNARILRACLRLRRRPPAA